jgi:1-acyl-sn-glycerol-3-phosphate acyltransferase
LNNKVVATFRASRFSLHLAYGLTIAIAYPWLTLSIRQRILQNWSASLLSIFDVRISIEESDPLHDIRNGLIVTNHISWLDVFVLNAVVPMRFVAKSEVRRWPVIGWLCARAQTLFIERGKARSAARINLQLVQILKRGECLAVFPEGTTTDGAGVAHFHSSLLQPAIDANVPLHPIAIRYQNEHGERSDVPAYIDDVSFGASLWRILCGENLQVRLVASPPLAVEDTDRRTLTNHAFVSISSTLLALDLEACHNDSENNQEDCTLPSRLTSPTDICLITTQTRH